MRRLVNGQQKKVIVMCSSTCMRMVALGIRGLAKQQLGAVIWMCSSTPGRMAAPLGVWGLGVLRKNQQESG